MNFLRAQARMKKPRPTNGRGWACHTIWCRYASGIAGSMAPFSAKRKGRQMSRIDDRLASTLITVAVNELELSALIFKGYLPEEDRNDSQAVKAAVEGVISGIAFDLQHGTSTRSEFPI